MLEAHQPEFVPDWFSKPADTLFGIMKRRDISVEALSQAVDGGMATVRGLMMGTQSIDESLANSLATAVGGSPRFWLNRQTNYERALDLASDKALSDLEKWLALVPAPGSSPRGRLSEEQKRAEVRRRLAFYDVNSLQTWQMRYQQQIIETQFRTSKAFSSKSGAVSLWLRQGELEAALSPTRQWNPDALRERLVEILKLSKIRQPERFVPKLKALAAEAGVAIIIVRAPTGCRASGASRLVSPDRATVLLSFRHLSDDHFWFTLFHEFGHLLLHGAEAFVDTDETYIDDREREANEFAQSCMVPPARWEEFINLKYDKESIIRFSVSLGLAPGLLVGQLQHRAAIPRDRLNFLKRRWTWAEIEPVLA